LTVVALEAELKKFRSSELFQDVVWQRSCVLAVPRIVKTRLLVLEGKDFRREFKKTFERYFMLGRKFAPENIIKGNPLENVKRALMDMFLTDMPPGQRLASVMSLHGVKLFFGSYLLSAAYDGNFIVYHEGVLEGIRECLPHLARQVKLPPEISEPEPYFEFNDICQSIKDLLGFNNLAEVHEFFWHGHDEKWFVRSPKD
jgi:hypothetical protein